MNTLQRLSPVLASAALAALAGCAVSPDFTAAAAPANAAYTANGELPAATVATPGVPGGEAQQFLAGRDVPARWWLLFGSEKLNALIDQALTGSPTVAAAQAALLAAQESVLAQRAGLLPRVDGEASATRQKIDTGSFGNPGGGSFIYNLFNAGVRVSYGIDLYGGTARGVEAQVAAAEVQRYQAEAAYQTLIANVVTSAVQQALNRALITGQTSVVEGQERLVETSRKQFKLGAVSKAEVLALETSLAQERARLPELRNALAREETRLAVYLGKLPSEAVAVNFSFDDLKLPQELPVSLPSNLVRQRPDVLAAEAQLHQAEALLGVAIANQFPQLTLSASYGSQSSKIEDLFVGDIWSLGSGLTVPIFRAGELAARKRVAAAQAAQATANYRQTVLLAFGNVADALRQLGSDAEILKAQVAAAEAAEASLKLTEQQLKLGAATASERILAVQAYTRARTGAVQALAARYQNTVALFQALGGGFTSVDASAAAAANQP